MCSSPWLLLHWSHNIQSNVVFFFLFFPLCWCFFTWATSSQPALIMVVLIKHTWLYHTWWCFINFIHFWTYDCWKSLIWHGTLLTRRKDCGLTILVAFSVLNLEMQQFKDVFSHTMSPTLYDPCSIVGHDWGIVCLFCKIWALLYDTCRMVIKLKNVRLLSIQVKKWSQP